MIAAGENVENLRLADILKALSWRRGILYRLPELLQPIRRRLSNVCEGEKDTDRVRSRDSWRP